MTKELQAKLIGYTANMQADKAELVIEINSAKPQDVSLACLQIFGSVKEPEQTTDEPEPYVAQEHKVTKTTEIPQPEPRKCSKGLAWEDWEIDEIKKYNTALDAVNGYKDLHHKYERSKESIKSRWNKLRRGCELNYQTATLKLDQKVKVKILGEVREGTITKKALNDGGEMEYLVVSGQTHIWVPRMEIAVL
jgi:hypothetical protein